MGTIVALLLLAMEIGQNGLAECSISERNRRFIIEDFCDNFQEYTDLQNLQISHSCTGANEVWTILERLYRYGSHGLSCMHQIISQLDQTFHDCQTTPSYCSCSGSNKLDYYYVRYDLLDYLGQCWQQPYIQLFSAYFHSSGNPIYDTQWCQSHHTVWHLLAGISSDICRLDIVVHIADIFHRLPNYCSCHTINTGSGLQQGTVSVTASIMPPDSLLFDYCLQYDSFKYLYILGLHPEQCISVNSMWSYLADTFEGNEQCGKKVMDHMSHSFKGYQQFPQHCVCTGNDIHRNPVCIQSLDQDYCRNHHTHYQRLHDEMYALSPSPCRSHQYMWYYFNEISYDRNRDCKIDFIFHAAATYPDAASDPCSCFSVSQPSQKTTISTTMAIAMTKPMVTTMTTTTATTNTTPKHNLDVNTTPDVLHAVPICSKLLTIVDVAHNLTIKHPNASDCTTGDHASTEALILSNCNVGSATMWIKGENVMDMCHRIPLYAPIATFDAQGVYRPNGGMAGIFLGCVQDGFKIASQDCNHRVSIHHITKGGIFLNDPSNYYIIRW